MTAAERELYEAWLGRARDDLALAKVALAQEPPITWGAVYHAHQAAEKAFKAVLSVAGLPPMPTHDLDALASAVAASGAKLPPLGEETETLSPYAVEPRYPEVTRDYAEDEAEKAIQAAERVVAAVEEAYGRDG